MMSMKTRKNSSKRWTKKSMKRAKKPRRVLVKASQLMTTRPMNDCELCRFYFLLAKNEVEDDIGRLPLAEEVRERMATLDIGCPKETSEQEFGRAEQLYHGCPETLSCELLKVEEGFCIPTVSELQAIGIPVEHLGYCEADRDTPVVLVLSREKLMALNALRASNTSACAS